MRRRLPALAVIATLLSGGVASAQDLTVQIDQSARLALGGAARDVVIGNPAIADVTVVDARNLVITGKSYGVTNVIVIDGAGRTLVNRQIVVSSADDGRVSFYRGPELRTYSCAPRCERTSGQPAPTVP